VTGSDETQPDEAHSEVARSQEARSEEARPEEVLPAGPGTDALVSRLRVIEDQPLESRASAFAQIHDELQSALEGGDAPVRNG
jgi:hypothetical protein